MGNWQQKRTKRNEFGFHSRNSCFGPANYVASKPRGPQDVNAVGGKGLSLVNRLSAGEIVLVQDIPERLCLEDSIPPEGYVFILCYSPTEYLASVQPIALTKLHSLAKGFSHLSLLRAYGYFGITHFGNRDLLVSLRQMTPAESRKPIPDWRAKKHWRSVR